MPISYSIDSEAGVIFEVWEGDVTAADLRRYWKEYLADPKVLEIRRTLVDLRRGVIRFTGAELSALISTVVTPALEHGNWTTALLVDGPVEFGVSRQYQAMADRYSRDAIFHDPDAALTWLMQQP